MKSNNIKDMYFYDSKLWRNTQLFRNDTPTTTKGFTPSVLVVLKCMSWEMTHQQLPRALPQVFW
jgi:hypothetical protein